MTEFNPDANPESVAARAAELSLEQLDRLRPLTERGASSEELIAFYADPFEVSITNHITTLMSGYAVLKGHVTLERANGNLTDAAPLRYIP